MRFRVALTACLLLAGCAQPNLDEPQAIEPELFGPTAMRIHPIFTEVKDWTDDGKTDGIEVLLEFQDQFGDPTKAAGTVMFELFDYRPANPEMRGNRLANPWIGSIVTLDEQRARWNRTSRTYTFQLAFPQAGSRNQVLTAMFQSVTGGRFFNRIVLEKQDQTDAPTTPAP